MRFIKVLLLFVLFIFGLLFFVQNSDVLATNLQLKFDLYYGFKWEGQEIPFYFVVLTSFGVGMLFATLLLFVDRIRLGCSLMAQKRSASVLEREVQRLKDSLAKETKDSLAKETKDSLAKETSAIVTKSSEVKGLPQSGTEPQTAK